MNIPKFFCNVEHLSVDDRRILEERACEAFGFLVCDGEGLNEAHVIFRVNPDSPGRTEALCVDEISESEYDEIQYEQLEEILNDAGF